MWLPTLSENKAEDSLDKIFSSPEIFSIQNGLLINEIEGDSEVGGGGVKSCKRL